MKRFKSISRTKKIIAVGAAAALTLGIAGTAFAYFTASATNTSNYVTVGSAGWTITGVTTGGGPLYPGGTTEWVSFTVTNTSGGNQALSSVTAAVTNDAGYVYDINLGQETGCQAGWFGSTAYATNPAMGTASAGWSGVFSFTIALNDSGGSQNGCENLNPQLTLSAS
jgi:hypothetical protein